jgi:hypothetical protein
MKKSTSLLELIIAIALVGLVLLGVTAFDTASRKFLHSSERQNQVLNEGALILDHMDRNALMGIGQARMFVLVAGVLTPQPAPAIVATNTSLDIRLDSNRNGRIDAADVTVRYQRAGNQLQFIPDITNLAAFEVLSNRVFAFTPTQANNTAHVAITLRFNTAQAASLENPQVTVQNAVTVPAWSLN